MSHQADVDGKVKSFCMRRSVQRLYVFYFRQQQSNGCSERGRIGGVHVDLCARITVTSGEKLMVAE